jgi:hypothetical protein
MGNYEWLFILGAVVGVAVLFLLLTSPNYKWTIVVGVVGLAVFTFAIISQMDRLKAKQWTLLDLFIVGWIALIVIWIIPDVSDMVRRLRRNQK